jgi:anaerobic selenocysteine-containing dehydrogenase
MMHGENNTILAGEQAVPASIPGEYDRRDDYAVWRELGIRLGQKEFWPWESLEEAYDYQLTPLGCTFAEFMKRGGSDIPPREYRKYEKMGFATPTGKLELYSTVLEKLGYDPLPAYREPSESPVSQPQLLKEYPLILITGKRHMPFYHSEFRQIDSLRHRHPDPIVQIHPETAGRLGIKDNDWVWIQTRTGRVRQKCQLFAGMDPRIVSAQHGWWFPELPEEDPWLHGAWESNINVCISDDPKHSNPILGIWPLRTALCKVYKCKVY